MIEAPKLNGKNWLQKGLLQVIIIMALALYGAVVTAEKNRGPDQTLAPLVKEIQSTVGIDSGRILRLETLMEALRPVPEKLAALQATTEAVRDIVEKTDKKVDTHIGQK